MPVDPSALGVYFLDVGQGDCTFVVPPEGEGSPILFDCADPYVAERFVANHGITHLEAVVVSHLDLDHIRGMLPFLKNHFEAGRQVHRLITGLDRQPRRGRQVKLREFIAQAIAWEQNKPHEGFVLRDAVRDGDGPVRIATGSGWQVDLVLPWHGTRTDALVDGAEANRCSAVLRIERGETVLLVGGDATIGSWERLEAPLRAAKAIRAPHHGGEILEDGGEWTNYSDLYNAVGAEVGVVSVGTAGGGYGHPIPDHAQAIRRGGDCRLLCTQLTERCHPSPQDLRGEALKVVTAVEWPYRHRAVPGHPRSRRRDQVPCAGSVTVAVRADGAWEVEPSARLHDRVIRRTAHPLCRPPSRRRSGQG